MTDLKFSYSEISCMTGCKRLRFSDDPCKLPKTLALHFLGNYYVIAALRMGKLKCGKPSDLARVLEEA